MNTPIYDELVEKLGISIPDPLTSNPISGLLPIADAATITSVPPVPGQLVDVPPRVDDWCEDRSPDELTAGGV